MFNCRRKDVMARIDSGQYHRNTILLRLSSFADCPNLTGIEYKYFQFYLTRCHRKLESVQESNTVILDMIIGLRLKFSNENNILIFSKLGILRPHPLDLDTHLTTTSLRLLIYATIGNMTVYYLIFLSATYVTAISESF